MLTVSGKNVAQESTFRRYKVHGDNRGVCIAIGRQTTVECFFICPVLLTHIFRECLVTQLTDLCGPVCIAWGNFILEFPSMRTPPNLYLYNIT